MATEKNFYLTILITNTQYYGGSPIRICCIPCIFWSSNNSKHVIWDTLYSMCINLKKITSIRSITCFHLTMSRVWWCWDSLPKRRARYIEAPLIIRDLRLDLGSVSQMDRDLISSLGKTSYSPQRWVARKHSKCFNRLFWSPCSFYNHVEKRI